MVGCKTSYAETAHLKRVTDGQGECMGHEGRGERADFVSQALTKWGSDRAAQ